MHHNASDMTGKRSGMLVALRPTEKRNSGIIIWICKCDCGNEKEIRGDKIRDRSVKSCGCSSRILLSKSKMKYGKVKATNIPEYRVWTSMKTRCYNSKSRLYKWYGLKGIIVCDRWLGEYGFKNFIEDMGKRPNKSHTIERINNKGNYEPSNCMWATQEEQQNNRSNNRPLTFNGKTLNIKQWSKLTGINRVTISDRLKRGWDIKRALTTPPLKRGSGKGPQV